MLHVLIGLVVALCSRAHAGCTADAITCYSDFTDGQTRVLGNTVYTGALTVEYCAQVCHNRNATLGGVEYGNQCMCGDKLIPSAKPVTTPGACSMKCAGAQSEKCGGDFQIGVFSFRCSGTPVPAPPSPPPPPPPPAPCTHFNQEGCAELYNPCLNATSPQAAMPFCDPTRSLPARAADMVSRMTPAEKIGMLDNGNPPIAALNIPAYNWWSEASTGVANEIEHRSGSTQTTKFAFPITTGMSFNRTLWQLTGQQIGREARALMNVGIAFSTFWAPVINLAREPRWGRNIETPGEDPFLTGEYAIAFTEGMQSDPSDPGHIMASACCKHYVANSMEHTQEPDGEVHDRQNVDSYVSQQDLIDSYMAPFQSCVEQGKVTGLMCSYNSVNGVPSCANDWLLDTVARKEWGFDGYITSDCDADNDVVNSHHYLNHSEEQGVADVLHAGTDVDCGGFVGQHAASALQKGIITEADIDERLVMLMKVRLRLGHFDPLNPLDTIKMTEVCSDYAIATSLDGPIQSSALLKNDGKALPLAAATAGTVAVIGPNAKYSQGDSGYYGPTHVCGMNYWTVVDAVSKYANKVTYAAGVPSAGSNDQSGIPAAVAMAEAADTVVLAVGTDLQWSAEGHDATTINFTAASTALIEQVAAAAKKPIVVVMLTATPLDISALLANPKIGAVLHTGQPSVTIVGISELLFGKVSPAGRTIQTVYPAAYQNDISIFDFGMRPGPSTFARPDCFGKEPDCPRGTNPGRTYKFYTGKAVVPFGFGLSYSSFSYSLAAAPTPSAVVSLQPVRNMLAATSEAGRLFPSLALLRTAAPLVEYLVNVTNTGSVPADDVVLGFLTPPGAGVNGVPLKQLFGFDRIHVQPGETKSVYLYPNLRDFTQVSEAGARAAVPGAYTVSFGIEETAAQGQGYVAHSVTVV